MPAGPMRQACFPPGAQKTWGFCRAAARSMACSGVRDAAADWRAPETSTDSAIAETALTSEAFAAFVLAAAEFGEGAGAAGDRSWSLRGAETEPSARKPGSEAGRGGGDGGSAGTALAR